MKVLITGACGRVGLPLVRAVVEAGHDVRATDRRIDRDLPVKVTVANLLDREGVYELVEGCDTIVHFGNYSNQGQGDAQTVFNENVAMNMNVFQAGLEHGARKVIFASSIQCISGGRRVGEIGTKPSALPYLPADGGYPPRPANGYALSKQVGEAQLDYLSREAGIATVALRFPHIVGEKYKPYYKARRVKSITEMHDRYSADELFSYILDSDVGSIVAALVDTQWEGSRVFFPASPHVSYGWSPQEVIDYCYRDVELRKPREQIEALIDTTEITEFCGWRPSDEALVEREPVADSV